MKILISIKRVTDYHVRVQVKTDGSGVDTAGVKMSVNPFDEIALEEAVRMKEKGLATEVVAVSMGTPAVQEQLRAALALGADRALMVLAEQEPQPLEVAKALAKLAARECPDLILLGKQAIDDDSAQTPAMLAGLLGWPQATFASHIVIENQGAIVQREVDAGIEVLEVRLPAVISTDLRLNEPRYLKLPNIMKARGKPIETLSLEDLDIGSTPRLRIIRTQEPRSRARGRQLASVDELVVILREKGLIS